MCLQHDNSYLFPAWFALSRKDVETLIARFREGYPETLQQPLFFPDGDDTVSIRLPKTPDVLHNRDGRIRLQDLSARFHICTRWDEGPAPGNSDWETHQFDLRTREGWHAMLETFPQEPREVLPEGVTIQRYLERFLEGIPTRREREFRQSVLTIHDAAHSRPGEELTRPHLKAINQCLRTLRMRDAHIR